MDNFNRFQIRYKPEDFPPPWSHEVNITGINENGQLKVEFSLHYTDREDFTEEELWEEGFSGDDDLEWKGNFSPKWLPYIQGYAGPDFFDKNKSKDIWVQVDFSHASIEGVPNNQEDWVYLTQEIWQAVNELAGKEKPLALQIKKIDGSNKASTAKINARFAERNAEVELDGKKIPLKWDTLTEMLAEVYNDDLRFVQQKKSPAGKGVYFEFGDQVWHKLEDDFEVMCPATTKIFTFK